MPKPSEGDEATPDGAPAGEAAHEQGGAVPDPVPPEPSERKLSPMDLLRNPIEGVQQGAKQVIDVLQAQRGVTIGWAAALLLPILWYLLDLGTGSIQNGDDAHVALAVRGLSQGAMSMRQALAAVPPPAGVPLALWEVAGLLRVLGEGEAVLRLLPVLAALGCAMCLLAIAIDVGVGRHAGGLGGLVLLALPLTYELSHRVLPDMLIAFAATGAIALTSHCLHGHKFDRHILPYHRDEEAPAPLPLRRWPMVFAALGIGAAALVDPRAGGCALCFAMLDIFTAHRYLLLKRRVWLALLAGTVMTLLAGGLHPGGAAAWLTLPTADEPIRNILALWHQGESRYGRIVGQVVIVAAGFGMLLGSLRRASRPLLCWVVVAIVMTVLGPTSPPPRGLGLVLPPLALCAAVGLESPVRWLGRFGMTVTAAALGGILLVLLEGGPVLHRHDSIKYLALSQGRAPDKALLCTVGLAGVAPRLYSGRQVVEMASVREVKAALGPGQPLSCLMSEADANALQALMAQPAQPPPQHEEPRGRRHQAKRPPEPPAQVDSVLATVLDREEPPPDTYGPKLVLVSR